MLTVDLSDKSIVLIQHNRIVKIFLLVTLTVLMSCCTGIYLTIIGQNTDHKR